MKFWKRCGQKWGRVLAPLFMATLVASCAGEREGVDQSVPSPFYSPFDTRYEAAESDYGAFLTATFEQHAANHNQAASLFLDALKSDPESVFIAERAFMELVYAGRVGEAAKVAGALLSDGATQPDNLMYLTHILEAFDRKAWEEARARIDGLTASNGFTFILSPVLRAWTYAAVDDRQNAQTALAPLLKDARLRALGLEYWAYMLDHMAETEDAIAAYKSYLDGNMTASVQPVIAYAHLLVRSGRQNEAKALLNEQAKKMRNNRFLLREGILLARTGRPSTHVANPTGGVSQIFLRLATEFSRGNSNMAAIIYLRLASYVSPEVSEYYLLLGELFEKTDNHEQAARAYASVPSSSPSFAAAKLRHIAALQSSGQVDLATDIIREALVENPGSRVLRTSLGDMLREAGEFEEAIVHYSRVIDTIQRAEARDWFVFFVRGICYEQLGNWPKAEIDLQLAYRLNPEEPNILNYLGYSWIDRGMHIQEAKGMIQKALEARPDDGFITDSYGWVHFLTGDFDTAVEYLEKAVRMEPDDVTINDHLGDAYWQVGRRIEARFQWRHALDSGAEDEIRQKIERKIALGLGGAS